MKFKQHGNDNNILIYCTQQNQDLINSLDLRIQYQRQTKCGHKRSLSSEVKYQVPALLGKHYQYALTEIIII